MFVSTKQSAQPPKSPRYRGLLILWLFAINREAQNKHFKDLIQAFLKVFEQ